jgi:Uma2 family endonuclease
MAALVEKSKLKKTERARPLLKKSRAPLKSPVGDSPSPDSITAEEFWEMQPQFPHERTELVNGKVIRMAPAGGEHGVEAFTIGLLLGSYVRERKLGVMCAAETGFRLDRGNVRAPDAAFISNARLENNRDKMGGKLRTEKFWPFAPDLAVEVVSPGDSAQDVAAKVRDWFVGGVQMVWIIYPKQQNVHVFAAPDTWLIVEASDSLDGGEIVPGFSCRVQEIFE